MSCLKVHKTIWSFPLRCAYWYSAIMTFTKLVLCLQKKAPHVVFCLVMDRFQSAVLLVQPSRCLQEVSQRDSCRTNCCICFVRRALGTVCSLRSGERTAHLWQLYPVCFDTSYAVSFNNISVMPTPSHTKHHTHIHIPLFLWYMQLTWNAPIMSHRWLFSCQFWQKND